MLTITKYKYESYCLDTQTAHLPSYTYLFIYLLLLLGFTTLFNILDHQRRFRREKSDKFCSEALISAWDSFTCCKSSTRDPRLYFPSEGSHIQDFYALKKSIDPGRDRTRRPRNHLFIECTISKNISIHKVPVWTQLVFWNLLTLYRPKCK